MLLVLFVCVCSDEERFPALGDVKPCFILGGDEGQIERAVSETFVNAREGFHLELLELTRPS